MQPGAKIRGVTDMYFEAIKDYAFIVKYVTVMEMVRQSFKYFKTRKGTCYEIYFL